MNFNIFKLAPIIAYLVTRFADKGLEAAKGQARHIYENKITSESFKQKVSYQKFERFYLNLIESIEALLGVDD